MKRTLLRCFILTLALLLSACGPGAGQSSDADSIPDAPVSAGADAPTETEASEESQAEDSAPAGAETAEPSVDGGKTILIAYFSATNNTENIANYLYAILDADLYEIVPETPYTEDDLNYNDTSSRSSREMNDPDARPAISGGVDNMDQYEVIFLGYPIWWGESPRILNTFLESYNMSGKTIAPFCTSASSPIGSSAAHLQALTDGAEWLEGERFSGGASAEDVRAWVESLDWD